MRGLALLALLSSCDGPPPISSCTDDLRGVYTFEGRRWMILDHRRTLEVYPLFDDVPDAAPGHEIAPRVIDLERTPDALVGSVRRRYMQRDLRCEAKVPVRVTSCAGDVLEIVMRDPVAPVTYEPCSFPRPDSSRVERWRRGH